MVGTQSGQNGSRVRSRADLPGVLQGARCGTNGGACSRFGNLNAAACDQQARKLLQIVSSHTREWGIRKSCLMCLRIFQQMGHGVENAQIARRYWFARSEEHRVGKECRS